MILVELSSVAKDSLPLVKFSRHLQMGSGFSDDGSQDSVLEVFLRSAIAAIESRIGKSLYRKSYSWRVTRWHAADVQGLPVGPIHQVDAVRLTDRAGTVTVVDPELYSLRNDSQRPSICSVGTVLPAIPPGGDAEIEFQAGWGTGWGNIPDALGQAVFVLGAHYYENRSGEGAHEMPLGVTALIEGFRTMRSLGGHQ